MNALSLLKQDHSQVAGLFKEFEEADEDDKTLLAGQICQLLTIHAVMEEELLYPAARGVLDEDDEALVDEATVEHASVKELVEQIASAGSEDELFEAKVTVLGEYVNHHVKEEEDELFPKLEATQLDLEALGRALEGRKGELMTELGVSSDDAVENPDDVEDTDDLEDIDDVEETDAMEDSDTGEEPSDVPARPAKSKTLRTRSGNGAPKR